MTRLNDLYDGVGQSPWIDNIRRDWLDDGTLARYVHDGVRGVTSNPSIFAKALATSTAYDARVAGLNSEDPEWVFEHLAVDDVRDACDVLGTLHDASRADFSAGRRRYLDGFVSLEVSPRLAHDAPATIDAARRLAAAVGRSNVMIKIPATLAGLAAIPTVLSDGINVNVTLIFSIERYRAVMDAWASGLELAIANGHDVAGIASVASFFVSRLDVAVDQLLDPGDPRRGTIAVAQVARAYAAYKEVVGGERVKKLLASGAQVQRPLWASTSTKNPAYDDLLYVDSIAANETVNTMPDATLAAALDRGSYDQSVLRSDERMAAALATLDGLGSTLDLAAVTQRLEDEGVAAFIASYDELLETVREKLRRRA